MITALIRYVPNVLTTARLLLAVPIGYLIFHEKYDLVLWLALFAGLSDGIDGWLARIMGAQTRYGAVVDPLSDKALLTASYLAFAMVGLVPWWFTTLVVARDILIVAGALAYHTVYGRYKMQPTILGKTSTLFQIAFALLLIAEQVFSKLPTSVLNITFLFVVVLTFISGIHYTYIWGGKAWEQRKAHIAGKRL